MTKESKILAAIQALISKSIPLDVALDPNSEFNRECESYGKTIHSMDDHFALTLIKALVHEHQECISLKEHESIVDSSNNETYLEARSAYETEIVKLQDEILDLHQTIRTLRNKLASYAISLTR